MKPYYHQLTSGVEPFAPRKPSSDIQGTGRSYPQSSDIAHRGSTEESAVLSVELADALIANRVAERIFAVLAGAGADSDACARSAWDRLCALQSAREGFPHREDRRQYEVRQHRLPQQRSRFSPENRRANHALVDLITKFAEQKKVTPAQIALAWLLAKKPWIVPIPGTTKLSRLEENIGAVSVDLGAEDVLALEDASSKIKLACARYPRFREQLVGR